MPSFDIISEVDLVEVRNAVDNSAREVETRFDFRGVDASIKLEKEAVKITTESDFQLSQLVSILRSNLAKRYVDAQSMDQQATTRTGKSFSCVVEFKQGVDQTISKKVVKLIKDAKLKVQASIQGDKVRVTGKKRDDLQAAMAAIRAEELGQPLQFDNFRD
ncbi:YajQ family cyclic di-GMP-binding protein [Photobacterium sanguinicancri]|uniref:Nucleotide-binding protein ASV53_16815 n=1 Tax=Photobacterium sanguinicancri TaxID=875932 RepID=A0AAW7Y617_9GAMM|nr:YajQ family cyclic di-GMP-binding protein [Photobacterium sanguinicancri]KXI22007.1 nucleotide-binding protein [Photobacterium sanguinicancri]MDO6499939.1 YajQ family cyclic di-GMP-binding protein [Photobacterium sanguinicancri]MDO6542924.1 YajQ family cyclic di-GMP-binding protein [Photobacterium sanguinicancri]OZS42762.1 YajQ family cyclic di-GMP-binding protein [Photobacterium sanguinicancri]